MVKFLSGNAALFKLLHFYETLEVSIATLSVCITKKMLSAVTQFNSFEIMTEKINEKDLKFSRFHFT